MGRGWFDVERRRHIQHFVRCRMNELRLTKARSSRRAGTGARRATDNAFLSHCPLIAMEHCPNAGLREEFAA